MKSKYYDWTKRLIQEGHNYSEIARIQGRDCHNVRKLCVKTGLTQSLQGKINIEKKAFERMARQIDQHGYELIDCDNGVDGIIHIKCKACGAVLERNGQCARKPHAILCDNCRKIERENKKAQKELEKEQAKKEARRSAAYKRIKIVSYQTDMAVCQFCDSLFVAKRKGTKYCSAACMNRVNNAIKKDKRLKRIRTLVIDSDITLERLYKRDNGTCAMCGCVCDWNDYEVRSDGTFIANDTYPSIDHIHPISKGGKHQWSNVQLACRACNSKKGANPTSPHAETA